MTSGDGSVSSLGDVTQQRQVRPVGALITVLLVAGAAMLATSGIIHIYLWGKEDGFRAVPTVGPLFFVQGVVGCVLAVAVVVWRRLIVAVAGAIYFAASMGGLYKAIHGGIFDYHETLDAPYVKTSLTIEIVGLFAFAAALVVFATGTRRRGPA
jgi:hypothetical protein